MVQKGQDILVIYYILLVIVNKLFNIFAPKLIKEQGLHIIISKEGRDIFEDRSDKERSGSFKQEKHLQRGNEVHQWQIKIAAKNRETVH